MLNISSAARARKAEVQAICDHSLWEQLYGLPTNLMENEAGTKMRQGYVLLTPAESLAPGLSAVGHPAAGPGALRIKPSNAASCSGPRGKALNQGKYRV